MCSVLFGWEDSVSSTLASGGIDEVLLLGVSGKVEEDDSILLELLDSMEIEDDVRVSLSCAGKVVLQLVIITMVSTTREIGMYFKMDFIVYSFRFSVLYFLGIRV